MTTLTHTTKKIFLQNKHLVSATTDLKTLQAFILIITDIRVYISLTSLTIKKKWS
jgi:hypothetical protein